MKMRSLRGVMLGVILLAVTSLLAGGYFLDRHLSETQRVKLAVDTEVLVNEQAVLDILHLTDAAYMVAAEGYLLDADARLLMAREKLKTLNQRIDRYLAIASHAAHTDAAQDHLDRLAELSGVPQLMEQSSEWGGLETSHAQSRHFLEHLSEGAGPVAQYLQQHQQAEKTMFASLKRGIAQMDEEIIWLGQIVWFNDEGAAQTLEKLTQAKDKLHEQALGMHRKNRQLLLGVGAELAEDAQWVRAWLMGAMVFVAAVVFGGFVWVSNLLRRPVEAMTEYLAHTNPNAEQRAPLMLGEQHELQAVASAINQLYDRIRASTMSLEQVQEALQENRSVFQSMFQASNDALMVVVDGQVLEHNPETDRLFGIAAGDDMSAVDPLSWAPISQRNGELSRKLADQYRAAMRAEGGVEFEWQAQRQSDGAIFDARVRVAEIQLDGEVAVFYTVRDISADKAIQANLEVAKAAAETAAAAKGDFLANMSHEIRTPINGVLGMLQLLEFSQLDENQRRYLANAQDASKILLRILNDILDFSKIEAGGLVLDEVAFALNDVVKELGSLFGERANAKGVELIFDVPQQPMRRLLGDPLRLQQVLINLVGNALKFTEHGEVMVQVRWANQGTEQARLDFTVIDSGVGMPAARAKELFDPFTQADSSTARKYGGTGLGLSIAHQLVALMGGELTVSTELGQGSCFSFALVLPLAGDAEGNVGADGVMPRADLRVLVAVPNALQAGVMEQTLERLGCLPERCEDAEDLAAYLLGDSKPIDVLLLDAKLPGLASFAATYRSSDYDVAVKHWVLLSAHPIADRVRLAELPVKDTLNKPLLPSQLFGVLNRVLQPGEQAGVQAGWQPPPSPSSQNLQARLLSAKAQLNGAHLLVAEDNPMNQDVIEHLLEQLGVRTTMAANGLDALERLEQDTFDGVLMDVQMPLPLGGGYETTRRIRAQAEYAELPIIAVTADAMTGAREQAIDAGMNDFVTKPLDLEVLARVLCEWIVPAHPVALVESDVAVAEAVVESGAELGTDDEFDDADAWAQLAAMQDPIVRLKTLPGTDVAAALQRLGGLEAFYLDAAEKFHAREADFAARFVAAQQDESDPEAARRLAHTLKGNAANLGFDELAAAAKHLQHASEEAGDCAADLAAVEKVLDRLIPLLGQALHPNAEAPEALLTASVSGVQVTSNQPETSLEAQLVTLGQKLEAVDITAVDLWLKLEPQLQHLGEDQLAELGNAIRSFDFVRAERLISQIIQERNTMHA